MNIQHKIVKGVVSLMIGSMALAACSDDVKFGNSFIEKTPGGTVSLDTVFASAEYTKQFQLIGVGQHVAHFRKERNQIGGCVYHPLGVDVRRVAQFAHPVQNELARGWFNVAFAAQGMGNGGGRYAQTACEFLDVHGAIDPFYAK